MVLGLFYILTVVVDTWTYTGDNIVQNLVRTHTHTHTSISRIGGLWIRPVHCSAILLSLFIQIPCPHNVSSKPALLFRSPPPTQPTCPYSFSEESNVLPDPPPSWLCIRLKEGSFPFKSLLGFIPSNTSSIHNLPPSTNQMAKSLPYPTISPPLIFMPFKIPSHGSFHAWPNVPSWYRGSINWVR